MGRNAILSVMPGDRLSQRDRERIAQMLGQRLPAAEIARRLGRPTSTVTREVTRNSGPGGYDPTRAHLLAERRGRRSRPTPAASLATYGREQPAVRAVEVELVDVLVRTGLARMPARVFAFLSTAESGGSTAAELVHRLRVSPASISTAVSYLHEQRMIRREREPQQRAYRYVIDEDVWYHSALASAQRSASVAAAAKRGADLLGTDTPAGHRLAEMSAFLDVLSGDLVERAQHWRRVMSERHASD